MWTATDKPDPIRSDRPSAVHRVCCWRGQSIHRRREEEGGSAVAILRQAFPPAAVNADATAAVVVLDIRKLCQSLGPFFFLPLSTTRRRYYWTGCACLTFLGWHGMAVCSSLCHKACCDLVLPGPQLDRPTGAWRAQVSSGRYDDERPIRKGQKLISNAGSCWEALLEQGQNPSGSSERSSPADSGRKVQICSLCQTFHSPLSLWRLAKRSQDCSL